MVIYEKSKICIHDIQNRINRLHAARLALDNEPSNKTSLT